MKLIDTYCVNRNRKHIWLATGQEPLPTDIVIEVRPVLIADEGKVCRLKGAIDTPDDYFSAMWIKGHTADEYEEIDELAIEEMGEEHDETTND